MSKVIKADHLFVDKDFTVVGDQVVYLFPRTADSGDERAVDPEGSEEEPLDLGEEAQRILQEARDMVTQMLERAHREAESLLAEARQQAETIRQEATSEAERLRAEADENGYKAGLKRAFKEMEEQRKKTRQESEAVLKEAEQEKQRIIRSAEYEIVNLALAVAEKIVQKEILADPQIILEMVRQALQLSGEAEAVKVMVNPAELTVVRENIADLVEPDQKLGDITVESDPRIDRGGCLVETEKGLVDARLPTRMANVEEALRDVVRHA